MDIHDAQKELTRLKTLEKQLLRERTKLMAEARKLTSPQTIDALTNMIDENIRKQRCDSYDEWQAEVMRVISALANTQGVTQRGENQ